MSEKPPMTRDVLTIAYLTIDHDAMMLFVDGEHVSTTTTEFRVLEFMVRHPGRVFTRDFLLRQLWSDKDVVDRVVDVYMQRVRGKIERDMRRPKFIKAVRGVGYRFDLPRVDHSASVG